MNSIGNLPDGAAGFDCNARLTPDTIATFKAHGYHFAVRYVRRTLFHDYDLTSGEALAIVYGGLALSVVQHVAPPGWLPYASLGTQYGSIAAAETRRCGVPDGVTVFLDLEGVAPGAMAGDIIAYCTAWHAAVTASGYSTGLYVGDSCGLTATQLYYNLPFERYWGAYNLNADNIPVVRGLCMRQSAYPPPGARVDVPFQYDTNEIHSDALGGSPTLWLPWLP